MKNIFKPLFAFVLVVSIGAWTLLAFSLMAFIMYFSSPVDHPGDLLIWVAQGNNFFLLVVLAGTSFLKPVRDSLNYLSSGQFKHDMENFPLIIKGFVFQSWKKTEKFFMTL